MSQVDSTNLECRRLGIDRKVTRVLRAAWQDAGAFFWKLGFVVLPVTIEGAPE